MSVIQVYIETSSNPFTPMNHQVSMASVERSFLENGDYFFQEIQSELYLFAQRLIFASLKDAGDRSQVEPLYPSKLWRVINGLRVNLERLRVYSLGTVGQKVSQSASARWIPPRQGSRKINCDASFVPPFDYAGVVVVCRDSMGRIVEGKTCRERSRCVLYGEMVAIQEAVWMADMTEFDKQQALKKRSKIDTRLNRANFPEPWTPSAPPQHRKSPTSPVPCSQDQCDSGSRLGMSVYNILRTYTLEQNLGILQWA
ncbi:unnamed protein product [Dovyalis caffra]|uniref:RNase H type-1 domain-containing protein n=1 Tax=Dovyalis caffra TaxID=77055 RepID=A0AAV1R8J0_9ROSI|nr:unnamed protein product [Dovyalis caffra]